MITDLLCRLENWNRDRPCRQIIVWVWSLGLVRHPLRAIRRGLRPRLTRAKQLSRGRTGNPLVSTGGNRHSTSSVIIWIRGECTIRYWGCHKRWREWHRDWNRWMIPEMRMGNRGKCMWPWYTEGWRSHIIRGDAGYTCMGWMRHGVRPDRRIDVIRVIWNCRLRARGRQIHDLGVV